MRRSRLSVRPNLGPKGPRGQSTSADKDKSDGNATNKTGDKPKDATPKTTAVVPPKPSLKVQIPVKGTPKVAEEIKQSEEEFTKIKDAASDQKEKGADKGHTEKDEAIKNKVDSSKPKSGETEANSATPKPSAQPVLRRSRFPKAKPNLGDSARQRARNPSISVSDSEEEVRRHPPTVHRTAPLRVSQGQTIPSTPPAALPKSKDTSTLLGEGRNDAQLTEKAKSDTPVTQPVREKLQEKIVKKTTEDAPAPQKEVKKRYKVNWGTDPPDRSKMTMRDLIHWNPDTSPMKNNKKTKEKVLQNDIIRPTEEEAQLDDPDDAMSISGKSDQVDNDVPAPQVMIGPDGSIIINEKSMLIESTAPKPIYSTEEEAIHEDEMTTTYASFRKYKTTKSWTTKETTKFYTALSAVGTDFSLIHQMFPKRTRREIKNKFKKEERVNKFLVDKALRERRQFDMSIFDQSESESEAEKEQKKKGGRKRKNDGDEKENPRGKKQAKRKNKKKSKDGDSEDSDGGVSDSTVVTLDDTASVADNDEDRNEGSDDSITDGIHGPTRSGRQPKRVEKMMYLPPKELASRVYRRSESVSSETEAAGENTPRRPGPSQTPTRVFQMPNMLVNEMNPLSPGKVMILANRELVGTGTDAKEVIHVFMVTPNNTPPPGASPAPGQLRPQFTPGGVHQITPRMQMPPPGVRQYTPGGVNQVSPNIQIQNIRGQRMPLTPGRVFHVSPGFHPQTFSGPSQTHLNPHTAPSQTFRVPTNMPTYQSPQGGPMRMQVYHPQQTVRNIPATVGAPPTNVHTSPTIMQQISPTSQVRPGSFSPQTLQTGPIPVPTQGHNPTVPTQGARPPVIQSLFQSTNTHSPTVGVKPIILPTQQQALRVTSPGPSHPEGQMTVSNMASESSQTTEIGVIHQKSEAKTAAVSSVNSIGVIKEDVASESCEKTVELSSEEVLQILDADMNPLTISEEVVVSEENMSSEDVT